VLSPTSREVRGHVIALAGPWRTSGEWWAEEKWMRDEWDVMLAPHPVKSSALTRATEGTAVYRIYRDLKSGEWFVDGAYD
jgi:protein ImuB